MKRYPWVLVGLVAMVMAACGAKKSLPTSNATAKEVAEEARGDVDCPADIETLARATNAPIDDVIGVRPGLTYEEATNVVLCSNDLLVVQSENSRGFQLQTFGQTLRHGFSARTAEPRGEKSSKQSSQEMQDDMLARSGNAVRPDMQPGQLKWYVGTMGLPGQERVVNAAREEWFDEGRNPTIVSIERALLSKYGTPTNNRKAGTNGKYLTWAYDTEGQLVTETSPLFSQCTGNADPDSGVNLSADCGTVVAAVIFPMPDNPILSQYLQVGVIDHAGGYQRIMATEQRLQQQENERRARQVQDAPP